MASAAQPSGGVSRETAAVSQRLEELRGRYDLPADAPGRLARLLSLVAAEPLSLTTVRDPAAAVEVHVADSLTALALPAVRGARRLADIGSGAGFPGLVLAAALPAARVTLLESVRRKADFLVRTAADLGLTDRVAVVTGRVEAWHAGAGTQDVATARAVAGLNVLLEYAAPLLAPGGTLVAWKGEAARAEETDARAAATILGMSPPRAIHVPDGAVRHPARRLLYTAVKVGGTPAGYPRRPGMARKRPLSAAPAA